MLSFKYFIKQRQTDVVVKNRRRKLFCIDVHSVFQMGWTGCVFTEKWNLLCPLVAPIKQTRLKKIH